MPVLEEMVGHLSPQERQRFRLYLGVEKGSLELKLFDCLCQTPRATTQKVIDYLYGASDKRNAYTTLRTRLQSRLTTFVVLDQVEQDQEPRTLVMYYLTVAYKFHKARAWLTVAHYLKKAEDLAVEHRMYTLLEGVYNFMIQNAVHIGLDLKSIYRKQELNWSRFLSMRKLNHEAADLEELLQTCKKAGATLVPGDYMKKYAGAVHLSPTDYSDPAFRLRLLRIFRAYMLSTKRYSELVQLTTQAFEDLKAIGFFTGSLADEEPEILYIHAHSLYRSKKFEQAGNVLDLLKERMPANIWITSVTLLKAQALRAALLAYTGHNSKAIAMLEELRSRRPQEHHMREWLNIDVSLSVYYFQQNNFRKTISLLHELDLSDISLQDWMGMEWCFKKDLIALLAHFEQGNIDLMTKMYQQLCKKYKGMLDTDPYRNAALFVKLCGRVFHDPNVIDDDDFRGEVREVIKDWEFDVGDIQAVTFFCWLKSKLHKVPYYDLLLTEASRQQEEVSEKR